MATYASNDASVSPSSFPQWNVKPHGLLHLSVGIEATLQITTQVEHCPRAGCNRHNSLNEHASLTRRLRIR